MTARQYACVACCQPAEPGDYECRCGGALAEVIEPGGITPQQVAAICRHFNAYGETSTIRRMQRLTEATGRPIWDYWHLTQDEATQVLERWTHGI